MRRRAALAVLALATLAACGLPPPDLDPRHERGARAPAFDLEASGPRPRVTLADLTSEATAVLVFYRGAW